MERRHERPRAPLANLAFQLDVSRRPVHGEQMCPLNIQMDSFDNQILEGLEELGFSQLP